MLRTKLPFSFRSQNEIHGIGRKDLHHLEVPLSTAQKSPLGCPENWTANRYILRDCYTMAWRNPADVTLRQPLLSTRLVQVLPQQLPIVFLPSALQMLR